MQGPGTEIEARHLLLVGFNYHRTPIAVRERAVIAQDSLPLALHELRKLAHVKEAVVLSTCNRTEVYAVVSDANQGIRELDQFFESTQLMNGHEPLKPNFKLLHDDVALHLFRVASGMDSLILGEGQIMSQVKAAHQTALKAGTIGPVLDQLFNMALRCGKRVRTETDISRRAASSSVSSAAIELARQFFSGSSKNCSGASNDGSANSNDGSAASNDRTDSSSKRILIIGAGTVSKLCMKLLLADKNRTDSITMLNRNADRFQHFTEWKQPPTRLEFSTSFEERHELAVSSDLVIVGTSATDFVLHKEQLSQLNPAREIAIIDLSVPRNVDPQICELPNLKVFHIDHLHQMVDWDPSKTEKVLAEAELLVFQQLEQFNTWWNSLLSTATIIDLRKRIDEIRNKQLRRSRSESVKNDLSNLEKLSVQMMNQFLHEPTARLKATADRRLLAERKNAIRTLFGLGS